MDKIHFKIDNLKIDDLIEDMTQIYVKNINTRLKEHGQGISGQHKTYIKIGEELLQYLDFEHCEYLSQMHERMNILGITVAFLVEKFQDKGLVSEEVMWLGYKNSIATLFIPKKTLKKLDLTNDELIAVYATYSTAKNKQYEYKLEYGTMKLEDM